MTRSHPSAGPPAPEPSSHDEGAVVDEPTPEVVISTPDAAVVVEQAIRVTVGAVTLAVATAAEALRRTIPAPPPTDEAEAPRTDALALLVGAALGATVAAGDAVAT
ncbi:MAG TPA: hypothetical protein VF235_03755, partial [Actinomycetota bacterium]